jgi:hypothetical protein
MAKAGLRAVADMFDADPSRFDSAEGRAQYIAVEVKGFRFLCEYPDGAPVSLDVEE